MASAIDKELQQLRDELSALKSELSKINKTLSEPARTARDEGRDRIRGRRTIRHLLPDLYSRWAEWETVRRSRRRSEHGRQCLRELRSVSSLRYCLTFVPSRANPDTRHA